MKRKLVILVGVVLMVGLFASVSMAYVGTIKKTSVAPKLDGIIEPEIWYQSLPYCMSYEVTVKKSTGSSMKDLYGWNPVEKERSSAVFYLLWDDEALYIAADVRDSDLYVPAQQGQPLNAQDTVQVCIDPKNTENFADVYILDFSPPNGEAGKATYYQHWNDNPFPNVQVAGRSFEGGYIIEAKVPWSDFAPDYKVKPGDIVGLGLIVLDFSPEAPSQAFELMCDFGAGQNRIGDPSGWNKAIFVE